MSSVLKGLVSGNKRRFQEDGFDLDLTYIYPNIIAMGFPAEKLEGVYRNKLDDVLRFLDTRHKGHYRVYNLCSERVYDGSKFHNRVVLFPFDDHHPPPIELIRPFCDDLDAWLMMDEKNIAVIHCKEGKGRTGVMICAYLLHRQRFLDATKCLEYYGKTRTRDGKGVTIPSQRRYVEYYGHLLTHNLEYKKTALIMTGAKFNSLPQLNSGPFSVMYDVYCSGVKLGSSQLYEMDVPKDKKERNKEQKMNLPKGIVVCGDICVDFFHKPLRIGSKKERIFQCWFNTFFVEDTNIRDHGQRMRYITMAMKKAELDKANKDKTNKIYSPEFKVVFFFETISDEILGNGSLPHALTTDGIYPVSSRGRESNIAAYQKLSDLAKNDQSKYSTVVEDLSGLTVGSDVVWTVSGTDNHIAANGRSIPPSSQSMTQFNEHDPNLSVHRRNPGSKTGLGKTSPAVDRRGNLMHAESESSMDTFTSLDQEDDFSDSDTDDEWTGCDVSAV
ncbi:phosphatidylinositol 3,4,5-trisphosphate 3-phosphatase and dual-specificity protein phosphatase PTEN-like isoform X7 [Dreissena polymorpha]|uniref:phosphatidylinositol 3,4,5-trisphosphate 3-phosphatase and dual-specificity protein phosphatase PTEN-like isoform X7 n=1 Tax=Dreissena polymorpha TaxID=45954 RepID=UPI0022648944|nr:phosphatidylinositol 3,4,5-trisphosphate 3-phosphatase and dual-specificity protein phosphatase PTEN-like isoform X7 [Dreissena polymorpha]